LSFQRGGQSGRISSARRTITTRDAFAARPSWPPGAARRLRLAWRRI